MYRAAELQSEFQPSHLLTHTHTHTPMYSVFVFISVAFYGSCHFVCVYLCRDDVLSSEGGNLPAGEDAGDDGSDEAQNSQTHTHDLYSCRSHPVGERGTGRSV